MLPPWRPMPLIRVKEPFDHLRLEGEDLRVLPLVERKRRLRKLIRRYPRSRLRFLGRVRGRGHDLYAAACTRDTEGVVAKWTRGLYHTDGTKTSWVKVK